MISHGTTLYKWYNKGTPWEALFVVVVKDPYAHTHTASYRCDVMEVETTKDGVKAEANVVMSEPFLRSLSREL